MIGKQTLYLDDSDQTVPFRQRRYFCYLSGVNEPDCHLTYDIGADLMTLYVPDFDLHRAVWNGPTLTIEEAKNRYDVDKAQYYSELWKYINRWALKNNKSYPIYVLHANRIPEATFTDFYLDTESLLPAIAACRGVKDHHEIELIRKANEITGLAHRAVFEKVRGMTNETEIEAAFLEACVSRGAKRQAYEIIAASGQNAATLHYVKNNEPLAGKQLVCVDAGCEWDCYASDVTRTFPTSGEWPSQKARDIYKLVEKMQERCIAGMRKGVRYLDLHYLAHTIAIEGLIDLGVLKGGTMDEIRKSGVSKVFFPHGLGHHVGLEVHDVAASSLMAMENDHDDDLAVVIPPNSREPCTLSAPLLEEGMVVTVEPGVYFSRFALDNVRDQEIAKYIDMDVAESYIPVGGVRIEDDILITADGYENLTTAPKGEEMLEIIRRGGDTC